MVGQNGSKTYWNKTPFLNFIMTPLKHCKSKHLWSTTHWFSTIFQHELSIQLTACSLAVIRDLQTMADSEPDWLIWMYSHRWSILQYTFDFELKLFVNPWPTCKPLLTFTVSKLSFGLFSPRTTEFQKRIFIQIISKYQSYLWNSDFLNKNFEKYFLVLIEIDRETYK